MKILSLWQPWASCVALSLKAYETRSWSTNHRGPLWIHAAKGGLRGRDLAKMQQDSWWKRILELLGVHSFEDLPRGNVLCRVELVNVHRTDDVLDTIEAREQFLGDYAPGRYAWEFKKVLRVPPVPVMGRQSIFAPSPDERRRLQFALRDTL